MSQTAKLFLAALLLMMIAWNARAASAPEAGKAPDGVAPEVWAKLAPRIEAAGLAVDVRGTRSVGKVTGDVRRLKRALGQLIDNAISATPSGGKILVQCERKGGKAVIVVSDNGRGMEPTALARAGFTWAPSWFLCSVPSFAACRPM